MIVGDVRVLVLVVTGDELSARSSLQMGDHYFAVRFADLVCFCLWRENENYSTFIRFIHEDGIFIFQGVDVKERQYLFTPFRRPISEQTKPARMDAF